MDCMEETTLEQARAVVRLLPAIMRQLFAGPNDPTEELPLAQLRVCGMLQQGARSMSSLSREIGVTLSALTQIADRLERSGLVCRVAEENDRRIRCLQLTSRGDRMMQLQTNRRARRVATALNHLSGEGKTAVVGALESLLDACVAAKEEEATAASERTPE
jgi:DNA-binding MarR family transcriptional regulator